MWECPSYVWIFMMYENLVHDVWLQFLSLLSVCGAITSSGVEIAWAVLLKRIALFINFLLFSVSCRKVIREKPQRKNWWGNFSWNGMNFENRIKLYWYCVSRWSIFFYTFYLTDITRKLDDAAVNANLFEMNHTGEIMERIYGKEWNFWITKKTLLFFGEKLKINWKMSILKGLHRKNNCFFKAIKLMIL